MAVWEKSVKKHCTLFLKEEYEKFKNVIPNFEIQFSTFCELQPPNVLLLKETAAEQCKCRLHENFILKSRALKIDYSDNFWSNLLCVRETDSNC